MVSRTTILKMSTIYFAIIFTCVTNTLEVQSNSEEFVIAATTPMVPLVSDVNSANSTIRSRDEFSDKYFSQGLSTGNELWDSIITDCYEKPTFSCFQKNIYTYLDTKLESVDVNVTNRLTFLKNKVDYEENTREANELLSKDEDVLENEIPNDARSLPSESPIEEVTDALYGKGVKFMMTHDIELKMPEMMFDGATFRISPRSFEGNGALVKLELIPKAELEARETGRIFKKKIQKIFKNKLLLSFIAIVIVIKLIKIKLFWLLPIIVGVGTAKKLLLKLLLFLFPALAHIFKLCSYYHANFHQTKYHHHHHSINHHHTIVPAWYNEQHHETSVQIPHGPELIFTNPPKGHPSEYLHGAPPHKHHEADWQFSGPGLGSEYIGDIHRNALVDSSGSFKPKLDDANDIHAWGLGTTHTPSPPSSEINQNSYNSFIVDNNSRYNSQKNRPQQHQYQQSPVYVHQKAAQQHAAAAQIVAQYEPAPSNQQQSANDIQRAKAQAQEALRIQAEQRLIAQQQKILQQQPFVQDGQGLQSKNFDPYFTPILSKIDKILLQIGFTDDHCKERVVCSMYKNPGRYSPHSNFISAELSRDTNELQNAQPTHPAVQRFYKFVQAARDGQDQRDCLQVYPHCSINTE